MLIWSVAGIEPGSHVWQANVPLPFGKLAQRCSVLWKSYLKIAINPLQDFFFKNLASPETCENSFFQFFSESKISSFKKKIFSQLFWRRKKTTRFLIFMFHPKTFEWCADVRGCVERVLAPQRGFVSSRWHYWSRMIAWCIFITQNNFHQSKWDICHPG